MFPEELHKPLNESMGILERLETYSPSIPNKPKLQSEVKRFCAAVKSARQTIFRSLQAISNDTEGLQITRLRIGIRHLEDVASQLWAFHLDFDLLPDEFPEADFSFRIRKAFEQIEALELEWLELEKQSKVIAPTPEEIKNYKVLSEAVENLKIEVAQKAVQLAESQAAFDRMVEAYKKTAPDLDRIVRSLNQVGMRKAFAWRALVSLSTKIFWGVVLGLALAAIFFNTQELLGLSESTKTTTGVVYSFDIYKALVHAALAFPLIWTAWFAARQYGFASKIEEDYNFKVATAASYEAYKQETTDSDPILREKLLGAAFGTFAENPLRIYHIPSEPGAPVAELAEGLSKLEKILDALNKWRKPLEK